MRRMVPQKEIKYVQDLEQGVEVTAVYPLNMDLRNVGEVDWNSLEKAVEDGDTDIVDLENHRLKEVRFNLPSLKNEYGLIGEDSEDLPCVLFSKISSSNGLPMPNNVTDFESLKAWMQSQAFVNTQTQYNILRLGEYHIQSTVSFNLYYTATIQGSAFTLGPKINQLRLSRQGGIMPVAGAENPDINGAIINQDTVSITANVEGSINFKTGSINFETGKVQVGDSYLTHQQLICPIIGSNDRGVSTIYLIPEEGYTCFDATTISSVEVADGYNGIIINEDSTEVYINADKVQIRGGQLKLVLPTSDPHVANAIWNDNGTLKISSGS